MIQCPNSYDFSGFYSKKDDHSSKSVNQNEMEQESFIYIF